MGTRIVTIPKKNSTRPRRTSLHPLTPEEALDGFMKVDPEKVKKRLKEEAEERAKHRKSKKTKEKEGK